MRIRTIKPEFFEDDAIGALSRDARLLVIGTLLLADDEGLLRWTPPYIKAGLFMYDDDLKDLQVGRLMKEVESGEFVFPYRGGKTQTNLAWIVKFRVHQRINRPQPGKLPPPSLQNGAVTEAYCRRDDWVCGICGESISQYPPDWGTKAKPTLDHIVPRSKGGTDYPTNMRIAHFSCNASRSNRDVNHSVSDYVHKAVTHSRPERKGTEGKVEGTEGNLETPALRAVPNERPDHDQIYLAEQISETWGKELSIKALQKLNNLFGRVPVTDALRSLRGFPPEEALRSPYAYLTTICENAATA